MTIIEFFDKSAIENIASSLLCQPDRVIFIGSSKKQMDRNLSLYREVLTQRGLNTELIPRTVSRNNLALILDTLTEIVKEDPDCVFDLTGGEDLYLVATGMLAKEYPNIKLHRFNVLNSTFIDCDADGVLLNSLPSKISIDENIRIYGGRVVYTEENEDATFIWNFGEELNADIEAMWDICKFDTSLWNAQINTLDKVTGMFGSPDSLELSVDKETARRRMKASGDKFVFNLSVMRKLEKRGLITNLHDNDSRFSLVYKNEKIKRCLTQAGKILELYITIKAADVKDGDEYVYDDFLNGVFIDWDGVTHGDGAVEVENEIDVMLMHEMIPVFISCKNGFVEMNELYKLSTVAERFGGKYAKKVLVVAELDKMGTSEHYIRARADEMGIRVIGNAAELSEKELLRQLKTLWGN